MKNSSFHSFIYAFIALTSQCTSSTPVVSISQEDIPKTYATLVNRPHLLTDALKTELDKQWKTSHTPIILETLRFSKSYQLHNDLTEMLEVKTKNKLGPSLSPWQEWLWKQDYTPHAKYPEFKSQLYRQIDPKFASYFNNDYSSTIRLDEVRWGGVVQDGIPPLRNPTMISAEKAKYLSPDDVVFGIEIKGEARAYPKRILAWHEMFVDTIQDVPLAGVY